MPNESGDAVSGQNVVASGSQASHAIKVPRFWRENPSLWFVQVEAQFALYRIVSEQTKFYIIIAELDTELLTNVSDIVLKPPADVYTQLKKRLIEHFSVSEERRIKQLLSNLEIGDKKPSMLLREMRNLANDDVTDEFLRTMWMQRLPTQSQAILSTSTEPLDNLAKMADKIADISPAIAISSITNPTSDVSRLERQIEILTEEVKQLRSRYSKSNSRVRSRSNKRDNSATGFCYYHRRFGQNANKCRQPCTFNSVQNSGNH